MLKLVSTMILVVVGILWVSAILLETEQAEQQNQQLSLRLNVELDEQNRSFLSKRDVERDEDDDEYYQETDDDTEDEVDSMDYSDDLMSPSQDYGDDDLDLYQAGGKNYTKVVIGIVSCKNGSGTSHLEQTGLLLKSILISAELYNVTRVDFHMFLDTLEDEKVILDKLEEEMGYPSGEEQVDMNLIVHSALDVIPSKFKRQMVFQKKYRCGYTRFFFPRALPKVDAIIHLNIDMIVTGNILNFWNLFKEMKGEQQMIGASKNYATSSRDTTKELVEVDRLGGGGGDIPQLSPKGINSGVLLMNLTRMRTFSWQEKFLRAFQDYSKITSRGSSITGQKVLNVLLFYNPALYYPLPCHFNFASAHCGKAGDGSKQSCIAIAEEDFQGIQLIHVNGPYNFDATKSSAFQPLIRYYHQFNMTRSKGKETVIKELMIPIRTSYDRKSKASKCFGKLNKVLFKNFFDA